MPIVYYCMLCLDVGVFVCCVSLSRYVVALLLTVLYCSCSLFVVRCLLLLVARSSLINLVFVVWPLVFVVCGLLCVVCCLWVVVCGVLFVVCCLWFGLSLCCVVVVCLLMYRFVVLLLLFCCVGV